MAPHLTLMTTHEAGSTMDVAVSPILLMGTQGTERTKGFPKLRHQKVAQLRSRLRQSAPEFSLIVLHDAKPPPSERLGFGKDASTVKLQMTPFLRFSVSLKVEH